MDPYLLKNLRLKICEAVSEKNHSQLAMLLKTASSDVINNEDSGKSALDMAAKLGDRISVELLLAHGAIPNYKRPRHIWPLSTLSQAIMSRNHKVIQLLVRHGCDPDTELDISSEDNGHRKPIMLTIPITYWYKIIELKDLRIFRLLVEYKKREITNDKWSQELLLLACSLGSDEIIRFLLDQGVSVESTGDNGWTCLFYAVANRHVSVMHLLIAQDANINHKDFKGRNILHISVFYHDNIKNFYRMSSVVQWLIYYGTDINATDNDGLTPINMTFKDSSLDFLMIKTLLSHRNIDLAKPDVNGVTPLHRAISFKFFFVHKHMLYAPDVDINVRDNMGRTPLQSLKDFVDADNLGFLLELGADSMDLYYYSKYNWLENKHFLKMLESYRLKRRVANLSNDLNIDTIIGQQSVLSVEEYVKLEKIFLIEIQKIKKTILCDQLTYYDFLHAKKRALIKITKKHELRKKFNEDNHGFFLYGRMLYRNYLSGTRPYTPIESKAINDVEENLNVIFNNKLPNLVVYNIKKYIDIEDMITLNNINLFD